MKQNVSNFLFKNTILICTFLSFFLLLGQKITIPKYDVQSVPPNPDVADLGKYGDVNTNMYNGTVNISIPLHTINLDGLQIPLALSYNTSGIRVNQESSHIGLGWQQSPNISITKVINGYEDIKSSLFTGDYSQGWIYSKDIKFVDYANRVSEKDIAIIEKSYQEGVPIDTEPDIFTINLPSGQVKFYLPKITNINDTILLAQNLGSPHFKIYFNFENQTFKVIDPNGFTYFFDELERSTGMQDYDSSPTNNNETVALSGFPTNQAQSRMLVTSWKVSRILSTSGRSIFFDYIPAFYMQHPNFSESYEHKFSLKDPLFDNRASYSTRKVSASIVAFHTKYLTNIRGDFGNIEFNLGERYDLFSVESLRRYIGPNTSFSPGFPNTVYSAKKLDGLIIRNNKNSVVKRIKLNNSYFGQLKINDVNREAYLRLKLDSIEINDKSYKFSYFNPNNDNLLPRKDTKAKDFWNFYNGVNNTQRIPSFSRFFLNQVKLYTPKVREIFVKVKGANRSSDINFGKYGILDKITYPTGGISKFNYESNSIALQEPTYDGVVDDNGFFLSSNIDNSKDYNYRYQYLKLAKEPEYIFRNNNNCNVSSIRIIDTFKILETNFCNYQNYNFRVNGQVSCAIGCQTGSSPSGKAVWLENTDTNEIIKIYNYNGTERKLYDVKLKLPVGNYKLYKNNFSHDSPTVVVSVSANATYYEESQLTSKPKEEFLVGGARISSIVNYDTDLSFISQRIFDYTNKTSASETTYSSGVLMDDLVFHSKGLNFDYTPSPYGNGPITMYLHSDNRLRTIASAAGSHIGYSSVTEHFINSSGDENGKVITNFKNEANEPSIRNYGSFSVPFWDHLVIRYGNIYMLGAMQTSYEKSNGKITSKEFYDENGNKVKNIENNYSTAIYNFFPSRPMFYWYTSYSSNLMFAGLNPLYPWHKLERTFSKNLCSTTLLSSKKTTTYLNNIALSTNENFKFDQNRLKESSFEDSTGDIRTSINYYPDNVEGNFLTDLLSENKYNTVVKTELYKGSSDNPLDLLTYSQEKIFSKDKNTSFSVLPKEILLLKDQGKAVRDKVYDLYDNRGNILQFRLKDGMPTSYIWGYRRTNIVAEVKNATYDEVAMALGLTKEKLISEGLENLSLLSKLRTNLAKSMTTSYLYKPLVGITSTEDPKGLITLFEYDSQNRLVAVKDEDGNLLKDYEYNYKK